MSAEKIFSFVKVTPTSMIASCKIAVMLYERTKIDVVWDESIADDPLDLLIIVNGAFAFAGNKKLAALGSAVERAERVVWVQNDYTIIPPKHTGNAESPFRLAFRKRHENEMSPVDFWTTVQCMSTPGLTTSGHLAGPGSRYVNWNALRMREEMVTSRDCDDDFLLYYGAYRKGRERYFKSYLTTDKVDVIVSSPSKKFEREFPEIVSMPALGDLHSFLRGHGGLGLYLEDRRSHREYHSPANRFYEMLSAGMPIVFQPEAWRTMKKAGYDVGKFTAEPLQVPKMMRERKFIGLDQQRLWRDRALEEKTELCFAVDAGIRWARL